MILTKDVQLELDQNNDLYGNYTYNNNITGGGIPKGRYQTKNNRIQQMLKTKSKYDFSKTSSLSKFSFLTKEEQEMLNIKQYLSTNQFHIITPDTKISMFVILKQATIQDGLTDDQRYLSFNPFKKQRQQQEDIKHQYFILNIPNLTDHNLTEYLAREYGNPCFEQFDFKVINENQIQAPFVVCQYDGKDSNGNLVFNVNSPLKNHEQMEDQFKETPIVMFKHQLNEILEK